eukprot:271174_1
MSTQAVKVAVLTDTLYTLDCVHIECMYTIDNTFLLSMSLVHDFRYQTIVMQHMIIKHANFNVKLRMSQQVSPKVTNESIYHGILSIVDEDIDINGSLQRYLTEDIQSKEVMEEPTEDIILSREITLKLTMTAKPDHKTNAYLFRMEFTEAPSLLHHRTFVIPIPYHQLLKQQFSSALLHMYNIFFSDDLITLIFDIFLTQHFWMYPPSSDTSIFETLTLNPFVLEKIATNSSNYSLFDCGLEYSNCTINGLRQLYVPTEYIQLAFESIQSFNNRISTDSIADVIKSINCIQNVEYVPRSDSSKAIQCNINGIGVCIEIKDESINTQTYPKLFQLFKCYSLEPPELSTIWIFNNPSQLYNLRHLYDGIEQYCDSADAVQVNARILIDKNIQDNDIAVLLIHWRLPSVYHDGIFPDISNRGVCPFQIDFCIRLDGGLRDTYQQKAHETIHTDFKESIRYYRALMELSSEKEMRDVICNDKHHFGEPLIALRQLYYTNRYIFQSIFHGKNTDTEVERYSYSNKTNIPFNRISRTLQGSIWKVSNRATTYFIKEDSPKKTNRSGNASLIKFNKRQQKRMRRNTSCKWKQEKKMSKHKLYKANKYYYHRW